MRSAILILCVALVAACSGQTATAPATATPPPPASTVSGQPEATPPASSDAGGGTGTAVAHAEVLGGKQAGTYDATSAKVDCNLSPTGSGATYGDNTKTKGLSGLLYTSGEGGASPAKFYFQLIFADPAAGIYPPTLEIDVLIPTSAKGHGTAKLEDKGATIKWTIEGAAADGTGIKATIECGPVDRS